MNRGQIAFRLYITVLTRQTRPRDIAYFPKGRKLAGTMEYQQRLGVAVWGIGDHARRNLLPAIAANPVIQLAGVTSRNLKVCESEAETYGCRFWPDSERMLADDEVDVVLIATPTGLHFEHAGAALRAGKHVWCENR